LFMASQKSLLTCGVWHTVWSLALRFALTPLTTALFAFLFGIRGKLFRIIAMQSALPPGVVTFVLANEYKSHTAIHSTGAHDIWFALEH
ncbi:unnamed protein product, partial [Closterium sp. NIES-64]